MESGFVIDLFIGFMIYVLICNTCHLIVQHDWNVFSVHHHCCDSMWYVILPSPSSSWYSLLLFVTSPSFLLFCFSSLLPLSFLCLHLFTPFTFFQSLSAPAQTLSCVESLCCYQHGQSGCSRLARFLEQMTGPCPAGDNHCPTSSSNNRWAGPRRLLSMIMKPAESPPPLGFKNLDSSAECCSP